MRRGVRRGRSKAVLVWSLLRVSRVAGDSSALRVSACAAGQQVWCALHVLIQLLFVLCTQLQRTPPQQVVLCLCDSCTTAARQQAGVHDDAAGCHGAQAVSACCVAARAACMWHDCFKKQHVQGMLVMVCCRANVVCSCSPVWHAARFAQQLCPRKPLYGSRLRGCGCMARAERVLLCASLHVICMCQHSVVQVQACMRGSSCCSCTQQAAVGTCVLSLHRGVSSVREAMQSRHIAV